MDLAEISIQAVAVWLSINDVKRCSKGQTLNRIRSYLDRSMFTHGQLYVALSRTRSASNIKILITNAHLSGDNTQFTDNIVYPEIL